MRWRRLLTGATGRRVEGGPTSANGASSLHLHWERLPGAIAASVELEVIEPPVVDRLYFWAVQASFEPGGGGAHLGLQWNPRHPGSTAVNWGGYEPAGRVLDGTDSTIPSDVDDRNTRTWGWIPRRRYRLRIHRGDRPGWWSGEVADLATGAASHVRQLAGGGDRLDRIMVWSEVFADCEAPSVGVRWSRPVVLGADGRHRRPATYRVDYQPFEAGGCTNTTAVPAKTGVEQWTATDRVVAPGATVRTGG